MGAESASGPQAVPKTILIVEDDVVGGLMLFDYLKAHGYRPLLVRNGDEGVAAFAKHHPDLVILDVALPRRNGFEVCFAIRRMPAGATTPVLLTSAVYRDQAHAEQYARDDLGAQGFLLKPFELGELLARVKALT